jgi:hypothetical protein
MGVSIEGSRESWLVAAQGMVTQLKEQGYAIRTISPQWDREDPDDPENSTPLGLVRC